MSVGGFGAAYDAVRMTHIARQRHDEVSEANHVRRHNRYGNQMLSAIMARKEALALLDLIDRQLDTPALHHSERYCPECKAPFVLINADGVEIETCLCCGSFWFDPGELGTLTHRHADIPAEKSEESALSRFECPVCAAPMKEHRFRSHHDLLVDRCPRNHGVYLEKDELERALDLTTALKLKRQKSPKNTST